MEEELCYSCETCSIPYYKCPEYARTVKYSSKIEYFKLKVVRFLKKLKL